MHLTSRGFPLFLTFDLDAETMWTARDPSFASRPVMMSQGAYGWKVGAPRILALLERYGIKATFFVPGLIIDPRPALMERILTEGHEIAHHSYTHSWILSLTPDKEREEMEKGIESVVRVSGQRPRGWRSPAAEVSPITMPMLVKDDASIAELEAAGLGLTPTPALTSFVQIKSTNFSGDLSASDTYPMVGRRPGISVSSNFAGKMYSPCSLNALA